MLGDNRRQRFFNNINDMMHLLGHLFHNLSDLHVNIRDRPPRQVHTMSSMQHPTSAIISAIPIEASINISNLASGPASAAATAATQTPHMQRFSATSRYPLGASGGVRARLTSPLFSNAFSNLQRFPVSKYKFFLF